MESRHKEKGRNNIRNYVENPENWYKTHTLIPNLLYAIQEPNHFEDVLCFVLKTNQGDILIDAGMGIVDLNFAVRKFNITSVVLTHTHNDHIGGIHHLGEKPVVHVFNSSFSKYNLNNGLMPIDNVLKVKEGSYLNILPNEFINGAVASSEVSRFIIPPCVNYKTFDDFAELRFNGLTLQFIHTPGHSPDSVCIFVPEFGLLFTGDTLYNGPVFLQLNESNLQDYIHSIQKLFNITKGKIKLIMPGHNHSVQSPELLTAMHKGVLNLNKLDQKIGSDIFGEFVRYFIPEFERLTLDVKPSP